MPADCRERCPQGGGGGPPHHQPRLSGQKRLGTPRPAGRLAGLLRVAPRTQPRHLYAQPTRECVPGRMDGYTRHAHHLPARHPRPRLSPPGPAEPPRIYVHILSLLEHPTLHYVTLDVLQGVIQFPPLAAPHLHPRVPLWPLALLHDQTHQILRSIRFIFTLTLVAVKVPSVHLAYKPSPSSKTSARHGNPIPKEAHSNPWQSVRSSDASAMCI